jgi:hypothetical protein
MTGVNGQPRTSLPDHHVLRWNGRVLAEDDLRRNLNGHRRVLLSPRTIVTPLAADELKSRAVEVVRDRDQQPVSGQRTWGVAQDRHHPLVESALRSLERDGLWFQEMPENCDGPECEWARLVAECVARGECIGGVIFCPDPGLVCCVGNKLPGLRATAVTTVQGAARAALTLGPNLVAVEMPGRTFFEVRQILRLVCAEPQRCPPGVACALQSLDGQAHQ